MTPTARTKLRLSGIVSASRGRLLACVLITTILSSCSQVPEWSSPSSWWESVSESEVVSWVKPQSWWESLKETEVPGWVNPATWWSSLWDEDETLSMENDKKNSFPRLSETPVKPANVTSREQRDIEKKGLIADRKHARYTNEKLRGDDEKLESALLPAVPKNIAGKDEVTPMMRVPSIVQGRRRKLTRTNTASENGAGIKSNVEKSSESGLKGNVETKLTYKAAELKPAKKEAAVVSRVKHSPTEDSQKLADFVSKRISTISVADDQAALVKVFSRNLMAQEAVQVPAKVDDTFKSAAALPIQKFAVYVPRVIKDNYNTPLDGSVARGEAPSSGVFGATESPRPVTIYFNHGSSILSKKSEKALGEFIKVAKRHRGIVRVIGHASQRTGDMPYSKHIIVNFNISLDRAERVSAVLRKSGIAATNIVTEARGSESPLYHEFMPEGEAQNRRVEVFLE